jgi:hypothetical protein
MTETGSGVPQRRTARALVVACGAIAHELVALRNLYGWDALTISCLPAEWHNRPEKIAPGVEEKLLKARGEFDHVFVAYGDCGTGGELDVVLERYGAERLPGSHCYEFLAGSAEFEATWDEQPATFFLTDFLARHFERLILRGLGIDRHPELLEMYFGNYERVLYLAQRKDPKLVAMAQAAADHLGLEYAYKFTGLDPLDDQLDRFHKTIEVAAPRL